MKYMPSLNQKLDFVQEGKYNNEERPKKSFEGFEFS